MKILIVQDRLRSGGTERQSILLARAFAKAGHGARLLTFRPGGSLQASVGGIDHRSLQSPDLGLDWFAPGLIREARSFGPDIVLCMGRMANCYGGRLQAALPGASVVGTLRTGKTLPWLFRRSLGRVRHVIANSQEASERLVKDFHLSPERISVIRNSLVFPAASETTDIRSQTRARLGAGPSTLVLLCVAMFRPEKNQRELIEITAGLPKDLDWQLWLAGEGPALAQAQDLAQRLGLGERVRFPGFLPDPKDLYEAADVAVHASSSESLSNFLIESQAHGLPVVAYAAQGVPECSIPGRTGWTLARADRLGFRTVLLRLAEASPSERSARSAEARSFARTAFYPARQVEATLEVFERLAQNLQNALPPEW